MNNKLTTMLLLLTACGPALHEEGTPVINVPTHFKQEQVIEATFDLLTEAERMSGLDLQNLKFKVFFVPHGHETPCGTITQAGLHGCHSISSEHGTRIFIREFGCGIDWQTAAHEFTHLAETVENGPDAEDSHSHPDYWGDRGLRKRLEAWVRKANLVHSTCGDYFSTMNGAG